MHKHSSISRSEAFLPLLLVFSSGTHNPELLLKGTTEDLRKAKYVKFQPGSAALQRKGESHCSILTTES